MQLRARMWWILGVTLIVVLGFDIALAWQKILQDQRVELEGDVHTIRGILMATRRVYQHQFIASGLPVNDKTVGFLPAHSMSRISDDYKAWSDNGYRFNNVSDRPRNPANRADRFELAAMEYFRANPTAKERMAPLRDDDGKRWFHYTAPIWIEGYCLRCHGAEGDAPESIRSLYPGASYDYAEGDLRGVMSIKLPMERYDAAVKALFRAHLLRDLLVSLLLFGVLGYFMDRFVLRRIDVLRKTAHRIADGEIEARVALSGADELSGLGADFNRMAEEAAARNRALAERNEELASHRNRLEIEVGERTADLLAAKDAAEAASRTKSAILTNMGHEIRTPLNAVLGMIALAKRRMADPRGVEQLDKARDAADRLLGVLNNVLDLAAIEGERMALDDAPLQLGDIVDNLVGALDRKATEKGLSLRTEVPAELAALRLTGDPQRLAQILLNLVGNAIKFTERGEVMLRLGAVEESAGAVRVRFEILDTGIGIDPDIRARLFESFEQADNGMSRAYGGNGLGLAICRHLVELMGGEIEVDSAPGKGSVFRFDIPLQRRD